MKKRIKTYGVQGLMEWACSIPVGKTHLRVEFSGGVLTQYGNTPAQFITDDLLKQTIIENSLPFKNGKITLLTCIESNEDETRMAQAYDNKKSEPTHDNEGNDMQDNDETHASIDETNDNTDIPETDSAETGNPVTVASLDDAKNYLNQKYGVAVRNLRSKQSILEAAKQLGVVFHGLA